MASGPGRRSMLADLVKDPGVVAESFALEAVRNNSGKEEKPRRSRRVVPADQGPARLEDFGPEEFQRLRHQFGVTWVVVEGRVIEGLVCPYRNDAVAVCRLDE